jgi:hypothetical protein
LGLELGKTLKLEWHKASNQRTRCLRITAKEEKAVRGKLQVCFLLNCSFRRPSWGMHHGKAVV